MYFLYQTDIRPSNIEYTFDCKFVLKNWSRDHLVHALNRDYDLEHMLQTGTIFTLENEQSSLFRVGISTQAEAKNHRFETKLHFELNLSFTMIILDKSLDYYLLLKYKCLPKTIAFR